MPQAPFNICGVKSCTTLIPLNRTRCDKHLKKSWEGARGNSYGEEWGPLEKRVRREERYCRQCTVRKTVFVDHIVPVFEGGRTERENLQGLCRRCHSIKTTREAARAAETKRAAIMIRPGADARREVEDALSRRASSTPPPPSTSTPSEQAGQAGRTKESSDVSSPSNRTPVSASEFEGRRTSKRHAA